MPFMPELKLVHYKWDANHTEVMPEEEVPRAKDRKKLMALEHEFKDAFFDAAEENGHDSSKLWGTEFQLRQGTGEYANRWFAYCWCNTFRWKLSLIQEVVNFKLVGKPYWKQVEDERAKASLNWLYKPADAKPPQAPPPAKP